MSTDFFRPSPDGSRSGIQSVEVGLRLLTALTASNGAMSLSALAAAADMSPSQAHKYLTSFMRVGLVRQHNSSGLYDLGRFALELGLGAMRRLDVIESSYPVMRQLSESIDETLSLTVWNRFGATIVRLVENSRPVVVTVRLGAVLDVLTSSNGRVFLAWLDRAATASAVARELADKNGPAARAGIRSIDDVNRIADEVTARGLAEVQGLLVPGITGLSAPIFGPAGLVAGLTVVGTVGGFDTSDNGRAARALREAATELSRELGGSRSLP